MGAGGGVDEVEETGGVGRTVVGVVVEEGVGFKVSGVCVAEVVYASGRSGEEASECGEVGGVECDLAAVGAYDDVVVGVVAL